MISKYYINITFTFRNSKLRIGHDHSNFQDSLVFACYITTRQDPMKQGGCCSHVRLCLVRVWGTWEGVLGLGGADEGIWRCRGTDAPWRVSEPPTQVNHPVLSSAKCAQAWVNHSCDGCGGAQGTAEIRDKISQGSQWIGLYRLVRWNRNSTSQCKKSTEERLRSCVR